MRIMASLTFSLVLLGILSLHLSPAFKRPKRLLRSAGTWWMIANDNGTQINIHAPMPDSLMGDEKVTGNNKESNFDEDKAIVPVILTCVNNGNLTLNANGKLENSTTISMDLELDVFTSQVITEPVIAMVRQLELNMLRKTSEVVCPSTISYAEFPSSRRKRFLQAFSGALLSFKVIDFTSMKFAVESSCNSERQNGTVCIHIASQLKVRITPSIPSDVETFPISNMIKNLIGSMMDSGEFDTRRALGGGVLSVRYSVTVPKVNNVIADSKAVGSKAVGILKPKSEAVIAPPGMNSLGIILVVLTLLGIAYAFFTVLRKKSFTEDGEGESVLNDLTSQNTAKRGNLPLDTEHSESMRLNRVKQSTFKKLDRNRSLTFVTTTNHDSIELEPLEVEKEYHDSEGLATAGERSHQPDWRELLSLVSTSGVVLFGARTPENRSKKRFLGEKYEEIDPGNNRAPGDTPYATASSSWKDMAYAIIEQRRVRRENSANGIKCEMLPQAPLPPPPPPPPSTAYTAQELLQLADLSHSNTAQVLHRSGPFNSWSPGKSPPTSSGKHAFTYTKQLTKAENLPKDFPEDKYAPVNGTSLKSSEKKLIKALSSDSLHDKYIPVTVIDLTPSEDTLLDS